MKLKTNSKIFEKTHCTLKEKIRCGTKNDEMFKCFTKNDKEKDSL